MIEGVEKESLEKKVEANLEIDVSVIEFNPFQPRTRFDEVALNAILSALPPESAEAVKKALTAMGKKA